MTFGIGFRQVTGNLTLSFPVDPAKFFPDFSATRPFASYNIKDRPKDLHNK
jgi:hypothetical protein